MSTEVVEKIDNKKARFSSAPWFKRASASSAIVGGVGNIGSWVSLFLARQGVTLFIYDYDTVDEVNIASQLYALDDIGKLKTECLVDTLNGFVENGIAEKGKVEILGKLEESTVMVDKYCFSCFDNMEARKMLFEAWYKKYKDEKDAIFIDGRLLAELGQVFLVTPDKGARYRETLFDDKEVAKEDCAYKGTTHCSCIIAGFMVSGFNNFLTNLEQGWELRDLPFNIDYQLPVFNFEVKS